MTYSERKQKAQDVIGLLSAFDVGLEDARSILAIAYEDALHMDPTDYSNSGTGMRLFAQMTIKQDNNDG